MAATFEKANTCVFAEAQVPSKARILCTEDDTDTRDLIRVVLGGEGYEVVTAESAQQALHLAKSESFDLYLIDNWMPRLSGDELTQKIREHDPETPILFLLRCRTGLG